jgi:hypothetical protein
MSLSEQGAPRRNRLPIKIWPKDLTLKMQVLDSCRYLRVVTPHMAGILDLVRLKYSNADSFYSKTGGSSIRSRPYSLIGRIRGGGSSDFSLHTHLRLLEKIYLLLKCRGDQPSNYNYKLFVARSKTNGGVMGSELIRKRQCVRQAQAVEYLIFSLFHGHQVDT